MRVLVTGGTGLIGIHAIDEMLRQGKSVTALVRSRNKLAACLAPFGREIDEVNVAEGDITDAAAVESAAAGCNALVHCAGIFSNRRGDAERLNQVNVIGTETVLDIAAQAELDPVVYISSYLALFPPQSNVMHGDDPVTQPRAPYARSKAAAEHIARQYQDRGAPVVTIYPASVQGPNDPTYGIGSQLIEQAIRSKRWIQTGRGRSYTDVRNLAQIIDRSLLPGRGPRRYMFGDWFLSDAEVIQILRRLTGRDIRAQKIPAPVLRTLGRISDIFARLTGKDFQLSLEAAEVLTRSVPTVDYPALSDFQIERFTAERSFHDLIEWMLATERLDRGRVELCAPDETAVQ